MKNKTKKIILLLLAIFFIPFSVQALIAYPLNQGGTGWDTSTKGDLLVGTSSISKYSRLPVGANGYLLTASSTSPFGLAWTATSTLGIIGGSNATTTWLVGNGFLYTATSTDGARASYFQATSTTASSTFTNGFETPSARALTSAGLGIYAGNSTLVGLLGAGNTANVAWYGSHTMAGNLIVDTDTLYVDSTNNKVGIGTTTGAAKFTVQGTTGSGDNLLTVSSSTIPLYQIRADGFHRWGAIGNGVSQKYAMDGDLRLAVNTGQISTGNGTSPNGIWSFASTDFIFTPDNNGTGYGFYMKGATGSLGIGTSTPIATLAVSGYAGVNPVAVASSTGQLLFNILQNGNVGIGGVPTTKFVVYGDGNAIGLRRATSGSDSYINFQTEAGGERGFFGYGSSGNNNFYVWNGHSASMIFATNGVTRQEITSGGNVAFDTNTLYVDATNNRVILGGTSSSYKFETIGTGSIADRTWAINNSIVMYLPDQAGGQYLGSLFIGNGGRSATAGSALGNTAVGIVAGTALTTGADNTFIGYGAGTSNTTAIRNVFIGSLAGVSNTTGGENLFMGYASGYSNTTAVGNVAIGGSALRYNATGSYNTAIGFTALATGGVAATVDSTTAIGYQAGFSTTGTSYGVYIGMFAGYANTTGAANTSIGSYTGYNNRTGNNNTYVGFESGYGVAANSHSNNSALGVYSLFVVSTGSNNTSIGTNSGFVLSTGSSNIFLGYNAGYTTTTGSSNVLLGYNIHTTASTTSNFMSLGNIIFATGVDGTGTTISSGKVGIASSTPGYDFSVDGTVGMANLTSSGTGNALCITTANQVTNAGGGTCTPSSIKFKENVDTLKAGYALETLSKLRSVSFDYKDKQVFETNHSYGMIAEEVEKIDKNLVDYDVNGDVYGIHFEKVTGLLVQAVNELAQSNGMATAKRTAENNWYWIAIGFLALNQYRLNRRINKLTK